ncbi:MAG: YicC/YloC family endoribonuclease [Clostridia bacterium]|nr:YicC/YloC family endoribonuclease [Clostridia bacterium]
MLTSMTGFGRAEGSVDGRAVSVEVRSLNHRYLDLSIRMPREFSPVEDKVRSLVSERIARGKVDVSVSVERRGDTLRTVLFDMHLARAYSEGLASLARELSLSPSVSVETLAALPDVITVSETSLGAEEMWAMLSSPLGEALTQLESMRRAEGERLESDIAHRIERIDQTLQEVGAHAPNSVEAYRARLARRVADMAVDVRVDEARLATEVALFADRCDYTEETVRFRSHIAQFRASARERGSVGKKLDFITQEMNREANTIASKSQDSNVSALVVEIKAELEKVREQIQNIE